MGCGKSTVGKKAAGILKASFYDIDHEVEKTEGMKIRDIFESRGEDVFRKIESEMLFRLSALNVAVISTGGGIVLMQENVDRMKNTGKIIWVRRPIETIVTGINTNVRPLIKNDPQKLFKIYADREPLYMKYADDIVDNTGSLGDAAEDIIRLHRKWFF